MSAGAGYRQPGSPEKDCDRLWLMVRASSTRVTVSQAARGLYADPEWVLQVICDDSRLGFVRRPGVTVEGATVCLVEHEAEVLHGGMEE